MGLFQSSFSGVAPVPDSTGCDRGGLPPRLACPCRVTSLIFFGGCSIRGSVGNFELLTMRTHGVSRKEVSLPCVRLAVHGTSTALRRATGARTSWTRNRVTPYLLRTMQIVGQARYRSTMRCCLGTRGKVACSVGCRRWTEGARRPGKQVPNPAARLCCCCCLSVRWCHVAAPSQPAFRYGTVHTP